ncbi:hypothetical protein ASG29_08270 [Sphingomonas sp. Leaf412]|nr:hypothetical protein ASG29_08270 [Sphingomonas sp. Leaf412]
MVFRSGPADAFAVREMGGLTAVYHRPSGTTHLLAPPAPEILRALADAPMTADMLLAVLMRAYDLADPDAAALAARIEELVAAGLVERA